MRSILVLFLVLISACASLNSVSTTSVPSQRANRVSAMSDKFVFLGFNFSNDYVDSVVQDLAQKCPNGRIEGILTKQESINYFLYIFWKSKITATGYCVGGSIATNSKSRVPGSETDVDGTAQ